MKKLAFEKLQLAWQTFRDYSGIAESTASHGEKILSAVGGFITLLAIFTVTETFLGYNASLGMVVSMGASAVLVFAVPHGKLSQPWPMFAGHLISGAIGIICAQHIHDTFMASSMALALSIAAMQYFRCLHPPGGATAITAVLGGSYIQSLGFQFLITPVLLDLLIILGMSMLFNNLFAWRRYPVYLMHKQFKEERGPVQNDSLSSDDFLAALKQIDSFVDVNEEDLKRIFELANLNASQGHLSPDDIHLGGFYSNGKLGKEWSIRQIINESQNLNSQRDMVIFKPIAGDTLDQINFMTREDFAKWAKFEMIFQDNHWVRK